MSALRVCQAGGPARLLPSEPAAFNTGGRPRALEIALKLGESSQNVHHHISRRAGQIRTYESQGTEPRCSTVWRTSITLRPSRSSFVTTSTLPGSSRSSSWAKRGAALMPALTVSANGGFSAGQPRRPVPCSRTSACRAPCPLAPNRGAVLATFGGNDFDLPVLRYRAFVLGADEVIALSPESTRRARQPLKWEARITE